MEAVDSILGKGASTAVCIFKGLPSVFSLWRVEPVFYLFPEVLLFQRLGKIYNFMGQGKNVSFFLGVLESVYIRSLGQLLFTFFLFFSSVRDNCTFNVPIFYICKCLKASRKGYEWSLSCSQSYAFVSLKIQVSNQELLTLTPFFSVVLLQSTFKELGSCFYYNTQRLISPPSHTILNLSSYIREKISYQGGNQRISMFWSFRVQRSMSLKSLYRAFNKGIWMLFFFLSAQFNLKPIHLSAENLYQCFYLSLNISLQLSHFLIICRRAWENFWPSVSSVRRVFSRGPSGLSDSYSIIMGGKNTPQQPNKVPVRGVVNGY